MLPSATIAGATKATFDGDLNDVATDAQSLTVEAAAENLVTTSVYIISVTIAGASGAYATATIDGDFTDSDGFHEGAHIVATIGSSASIATSGLVKVDAHTQGVGNKATASTDIDSGALFGSIAIAASVAEVGAGVKAVLDGAIVTAGGVTVQAIATYDVDATTEVLAVGIGFAGAGAGANANVTETANVEALVGGGAISSTGAILVKADGTYDSLAVSDVGAGGILAIGVALPSARNDAGVRALLDGDVTSATGINVEAYATRGTTATSEAVSVGLGAVRAGQAEAIISNKANTDAIIGSNSDINVPTAPVVVKSVATNDAKAYISSHTLGAVAVTITSPTAEVKATTSAQLNGDVGTTTTGVGIDGVSGTIGVAGASSVSVTAAAIDRASAKVITLTVGLVSVDPSTAKATVQSTVNAAAGGGHVTATGSVEFIAESHTDADANTDSSGGGAISVQDLDSIVDVKPTVTVTVSGGLIQAGTVLTIAARHGALPPELSDGTISCVNFGAGDGSTCGNVADSINFTKPHGLITGDTVTYEASGLIGGLIDGADLSGHPRRPERLPPRRPVRAGRLRRQGRGGRDDHRPEPGHDRVLVRAQPAHRRPRPLRGGWRRAAGLPWSRRRDDLRGHRGRRQAHQAPPAGRAHADDRRRAPTSTPRPRSSTSPVTGSTRTTPSPYHRAGPLHVPRGRRRRLPDPQDPAEP